ncbi:MAG: selenoneine synthase SenA [Acidobacteriota bacterium]
MSAKPAPSLVELFDALVEARERTLELIAELDDDQMIGPRLRIVNPLRWEVAHVAWFQERWLLRHLNQRAPVRSNGDSLYDSARVHHDTRWDLPLPSKEKTLAYMQEILHRALDLRDDPRARQVADDGYDLSYFLHLVLFHECMHAEAITYTRQTLGYCAPQIKIAAPADKKISIDPEGKTVAMTAPRVWGDTEVPGGKFLLGSLRESGFAFDNEQWAHEVEVAPFAISKTAVSNGEFAVFVEEGGYHRRELWSEAGWAWRESAQATRPLYWKRLADGRWLRRDFSEWVPLEDRRAVIHVNWFEADAYCRWAGRRLPTEAEWEMAASCEMEGGEINERKRVYPWGDEPPRAERANLDWKNMGCTDVDALPLSDSAFGCRQMIGNSWEWTVTDFHPFPGFEPGPYKEYSEPWFGDHKILRGGCWTTRSSMIRNSYRNFYTPDRRDVWAGFRTCAIEK